MPVRRRRRPNIREVEVDVVSPVDGKGEASDADARRDQTAEPRPDLGLAESRETPPTNDDPGEPAGEQHVQERPPAWPAPVSMRDTSVVTQMEVDHVCEITFWRGYVKAAFYARLVGDSNPLAAVAQSPYFRHRGATLPESAGDALSAYEALRQQLEHAGWQHVRPGRVWFADVFSRRA